MIERVLDVDIQDAIKLFEPFKWKFYEVDEDDKIIRIEVPRRDSEITVVELPLKDNYINRLRAEGFIKQTIRPVRSI